MRACGLLLLAILGGCGGGGGGAPQSAIIDFGLVAADAPTVREVTFSNPFAGPSNVDAAGESGPFRAAPGEFPSAAPGGLDFALRVEFTPPSTGEFEGSVTVRFMPVGGGDPASVTVRLRATAEAAKPKVLTTSLDFGDVRISETASRRMTVVNGSRETAISLPAPSIPPAFSIPATAFPLRVGPQETVTLDVQYSPTTLGAHSFDLVLPYDAAGAPLKIPVMATTSTWPEEMVVDYGEVALDASGLTPWLEVDVTPHAISVTFEASTATHDAIEVDAIEGPGGFAPPLPPYGLFWYHPKRGIQNVTLPWTDDASQQLVPGGGIYRFRFRHESGPATTLRVRALVENRVGGVALAGVVDLNVFFSPGTGVTPQTAAAWIQPIISGVDGILGKGGLAIGDVAFHFLTDPAFDSIDLGLNPDGLYQLCEQSAAAAEARVNVFYVRSLRDSVLTISGRTASIQGPASNGWMDSGVAVVSIDDGAVTAHEILHYLGLHHPLEGDAITDTPAGLPGNIMSAATLAGTLTAGQAHVVLRHPLVRSP